MEKTKVYFYLRTYGSHKHEVLVIQEGGNPYDTMRNSHKMLDIHARDFYKTFFEEMGRFLNEHHEVIFL